jgi:hypothetical protein
MTTPPTPTARERLRAVLEASGLTIEAFATTRLYRNERTVRRWLKGYNPIPFAVREWLRQHPDSKGKRRPRRPKHPTAGQEGPATPQSHP